VPWTCSRCGAVHEGIPFSFAWGAPDHWAWVPESERAERGECHDDVCWIVDDAGDLAHFMRGTIEIPILDPEDPGDEDQSSFVFGVWASVSEPSFERILELDEQPEREGEGFFGWLSNRIRGYDDTLNLPTDVWLREPGIRPLIVPQRGEHELAKEQHAGMTLDRARELAEAHLHG